MSSAYSRNWEVDYAIARVAADYGDRISVDEKLKTLLKFGFNGDVDTSYETVWSTGGDETYLTTNAIDSISSSSAADTSIQIQYEYHTVVGTGVDQVFTFGVSNVTLDASNGQTRVALPTAAARTSRGRVLPGNPSFAGDIYLYENTALTAGVPIDASKIHLKLTAADQKSQKAASTISGSDYYLVDALYCAVSQKTSGTASVQFQIRPPGGNFETTVTLGAGQSGTLVQLTPYFIVPKNHDFRFRAIGSTANLEVIAFCNGYLASVQ